MYVSESEELASSDLFLQKSFPRLFISVLSLLFGKETLKILNACSHGIFGPRLLHNLLSVFMQFLILIPGLHAVYSRTDSCTPMEETDIWKG